MQKKAYKTVKCMAKAQEIPYHARMDSAKEYSIISVCQGPECREWGSPKLLHQLKQQGFLTSTEHCQGLCHFAPIVHLNQRCIAEATMKKIVAGLNA